MDSYDKIPESLQRLMNLLEAQLSTQNLQQIIEKAVVSIVSKHIESYITKQIEIYIDSLIQQEISKVTESYQKLISEIYEAHNKNVNLLKSIQYHIAQNVNPKIVDPIIEAFDNRNFTEGFNLLIEISDESRLFEYFKYVNLNHVNEENISQDLALRVGLWALNKPWEECVERMCMIIQKGPKLSEMLRKIVSRGEASLSKAKGIAIKKSV
ncbi:hypothetical protein SteCoe_35600 [Stentor coeruleus]|uniref:Uncharacterized protein n=1 Tax=Stentor coeruleus TaxID=5963 RepID=A0A1R2ARW9_9CILI|nr:hypothetical protein SteCoe_35600 [Stentor coeruleus]